MVHPISRADFFAPQIVMCYNRPDGCRAKAHRCKPARRAARSIDTANAEPLARVACPKCGEKVRVERTFDNFVLLETLGIGGMGTVYKARDTLLDRLVALKLLRKDLEGGIDQAKQLQQEARVAASVNHPNVVQVFSSGTDHGQFYLVMELVDHGSLDDFIEQRKRLPEEQVLEDRHSGRERIAGGLRERTDSSRRQTGEHSLYRRAHGEDRRLRPGGRGGARRGRSR